MKISEKNSPRTTFWDILDDFGKIDIFGPRNRPKGWFTVKIAPLNGYKKTKKRSKQSDFRLFRPKIHFFFSLWHFQPHTAGISLVSRKTKKLGRFFGKNQRFGLKLGVFVKKSKNRSKNRVFDFFDLKIEFFCRKPVFTSYAIYKKLIALKIKKLRPF